ncbi:hypothetical protein GGH99_005386, partial [Coemansia sp. RSA 1285]
LFTSLGGAVSADCLDYTKGNTLDTAASYTVYVDDGIDGKADKYKVENITVHPDFNPTTKANNIATLRFNNGKNATWFNNIGITRETYWGKMVYTRSTITDLETMKWEDPDFVYDPASEDSACDSMSAIYNANTYDFTCIGDYAKSPGSNLTPCSTPYGTAYTYINNTLYPVGFYSYSSAVGDVSENGLCDASSVRNYYLVLSDWIVYVSMAADLADFRWYPMTVDSLPIYSPNYTLRDPGISDPDKYSIVGGDYYKDQGVFTSFVESGVDASSTELSETSNNDKTSTDGSDSVASDDTALFFLIRRWNRSRKMEIEDPVIRATMEDVESPGADDNYFSGNIRSMRPHPLHILVNTHSDQPPIYDDDIPITTSPSKTSSVDKKK